MFVMLTVMSVDFSRLAGGRAADDHRLRERGQPVRYSRGLLWGEVSTVSYSFTFLVLSASFPLLIGHQILERFSPQTKNYALWFTKIRSTCVSKVVQIIVFITGGLLFYELCSV